MRDASYSMKWILELCKMHLAYTFGFNKEAKSIGKKLFSQSFSGVTFLSLPFMFHYSITCYRLFQSSVHKRHLHTARKCRNFLAQQQASGNITASPYLIILKVEEISLKTTNPWELFQACNNAVDRQTAAEGLTHLEALSNE